MTAPRYGPSIRVEGVTEVELPVHAGWGDDHNGWPVAPPQPGNTVVAYIDDGAPFTAPPGWQTYGHLTYRKVDGTEAPTATLTLHSPGPHVVLPMILEPSGGDRDTTRYPTP